MSLRPYTAWEVVQEALPVLSTGQRLTPFRAAARFFDKVEIRTEWTPPVAFDVATLDAPGPPNPLAATLKPTLTFTGRAGRYVVAPYGEAGRAGGLKGAGLGLGALLGLLGAGFALGKLHSRWRR